MKTQLSVQEVDFDEYRTSFDYRCMRFEKTVNLNQLNEEYQTEQTLTLSFQMTLRLRV